MRSSCPTLFVCTAILCWDYNSLNYSFFNLTKCTPSAFFFKSNVQLIPVNNNSSSFSFNGFICSNCTGENLFEYNLNPINQCSTHQTMIELRNYCHYKRTKTHCQCFASNQPIQPIKDWVQAVVKSDKSRMNVIRVNDINNSSSTSVYILMSSILFLIIFGGFIGMIFYWIKSKHSNKLKGHFMSSNEQ
jgi:hypothetical protein